MSEIKNTRLRFISASTAEEVSEAVDALPFKVELKQILKAENKWFCFFVIPENAGLEFSNVEL